MTSNLQHRAHQHKQHLLTGFSDTYNTTRLVYYEQFRDVHSAIARETQLKHWRRSKKEWLVERMDPSWRDLAQDWGTQFKPAKKDETQGGSTPPLCGVARHDTFNKT